MKSGVGPFQQGTPEADGKGTAPSDSTSVQRESHALQTETKGAVVAVTCCCIRHRCGNMIYIHQTFPSGVNMNPDLVLVLATDGIT